MRVSPLTVAVVSFALAMPVSAIGIPESLSLSRYRVRLEVIGPGSDVQAISSVEDDFGRRCRDDDGCEVTIVITGSSHEAVQGRIFFLENGTSWIGDGVVGANPDFSIDAVIGVFNANVTCYLWDADTVFFDADITDAITLAMASNVPGTVATQCTMTVID